MARRVPKEIQERIKRFDKLVYEHLLTLGMVALDGNNTKEPWLDRFQVTLYSDCGLVNVSGGLWFSEDTIYTVFFKFEEPERAVTAQLPDVNPHSGKWNMHMEAAHQANTAGAAFQQFKFRLGLIKARQPNILIGLQREGLVEVRLTVPDKFLDDTMDVLNKEPGLKLVRVIKHERTHDIGFGNQHLLTLYIDREEYHTLKLAISILCNREKPKYVRKLKRPLPPTYAPKRHTSAVRRQQAARRRSHYLLSDRGCYSPSVSIEGMERGLPESVARRHRGENP